MNRAERRRQKKQAQKTAQNAKSVQAGMPFASPQSPGIQHAIALAVQHHSAGRLSEAEKLYQQVLQADPNQPDALHLLGVIAYQTNRHEIAVDFIRKALANRPDFADAHYNLGNALMGLGNLDDAAASFQRAVAINPNSPAAHSNLGLALQGLGNNDDAIASFRKAIAAKPDFAEAHFNLGNALKNLGRLEDAVASYRAALAINPNSVKAHANLGHALQGLGKLDDAIACFHKAIAINPDFAEAHSNLGLALQELDELDDATACFHKAIALNPDFAEAHYNLGNALKALGRLDDAIAGFREAIALKPDFAEAYNNLGNIFTDLGRMNEAADTYRKALAAKPDNATAYSNLIFSLNYTSTQTAADLLHEARNFGERVLARARPVANHENTPDPDRKLRIGLVSGDFRHHSVSYFLDGILGEINADAFALYAYSNFHGEDEMTATIRTRVSKFTKVPGLTDAQLAEAIVQDGIDILVDLSGHTGFNRLPLFSWKPAPVQVTWLGYNGTTGVEAIDYILCDRVVLPPAEEPNFVEKPWRLPDLWVCFTPPGLRVDVAAVPALKNGHVTFGSFNNLTKVTRETMACWAQILQSVPNSRLLLKSRQLSDAGVQDDVAAAFDGLGVERSRLALMGETADKADHYAMYNQVDIALDPFPYAGTTSTVEALWMGTPLVTLRGNSFISHSGESILRNVGLDDWIGETPSDYVERAVAFAADLPALSDLSKEVRERLLASPVCDAPRFARNLEAAFRGMWREWCG